GLRNLQQVLAASDSTRLVIATPKPGDVRRILETPPEISGELYWYSSAQTPNGKQRTNYVRGAFGSNGFFSYFGPNYPVARLVDLTHYRGGMGGRFSNI